MGARRPGGAWGGLGSRTTSSCSSVFFLRASSKRLARSRRDWLWKVSVSTWSWREGQEARLGPARRLQTLWPGQPARDRRPPHRWPLSTGRRRLLRSPGPAGPRAPQAVPWRERASSGPPSRRPLASSPPQLPWRREAMLPCPTSGRPRVPDLTKDRYPFQRTALVNKPLNHP